MAHSYTHHAIVLHGYDVGEADRFCILLSKEKGLIAARARGVRKVKSRIGGSILPLQEIQVTLHEGASGWHIVDSSTIGENTALTLDSYLYANQCADIIISMIENEYPIPEIFTLMQEYLFGCKNNKVKSVFPFTIRLLYELGLLPMHEDHRVFIHLSEDERNLLKEIRSSEKWMECNVPENNNSLDALCNSIVENNSRRPLKAKNVAANCI
ncbi:MAG: DNA repair protein RecO [Candidatus Peribacteraceae bacterium]|nr:DNA repair protein RecO [Candidatus Peribacteraceae bacterium]